MNEPNKFEIPLSEKLKSIPGFFGIRLDEEPPYEVLSQDGDKEIRLYNEQTWVSTPMRFYDEKEREQAFLRLAKYIFGNSISMTIPVVLKEDSDGWVMSFVLPKTVPLDLAPHPADEHVVLSRVEPQIFATLRYSGNYDLRTMNAKARELEMWVSAQSGFRSASIPRWANYDAPITIPFLKRNEAQIQVLPMQ